jgi:hypothetical protein
MPLFPTLDHVVVNVHQRMDEAAETYRRLGFTLTPRGHHSLGSMNHLAIFGTDYLELIGVRPEGGRQDLLGWPIGLNGLVWGSEDAAETHAGLEAAGVAPLAVQSFTRPVEVSDGVRDAAFRTVRLPSETTPAGRLYFCQHLTRDLVWRDAWRAHANGAVGVAGAVMVAREPGRLGALFSRMFGADAVRPIEGGVRLAVGLTWFDVISRGALVGRFGAAAMADDGREEAMAALVLRTSSLAKARRGLVGGVVREIEGRLVVAPDETFGVTLAFEE